MAQKTVSKNAEVTLTIGELLSIVGKAVEEALVKKVPTIVDKQIKKVINEYVDQGILGNPDTIQLQEQNAKMEKLIELQRQMNELAGEMNFNLVPTQNMLNENSVQHPSQINNANKFERAKHKTQFENQAAKMMGNQFGSFNQGTLNVTTNNAFGGANGTAGLDDGTPFQALSEPPQITNRINTKIAQAAQTARSPQEAALFEALMGAEGGVDLIS